MIESDHPRVWIFMYVRYIFQSRVSAYQQDSSRVSFVNCRKILSRFRGVFTAGRVVNQTLVGKYVILSTSTLETFRDGENGIL